MPRLVTKFSYIRPGKGKSPGGYAKYIATREGVEKLDNSHKYDPVSQTQKQLIGKILKDFPEMENTDAYAQYLGTPNRGNASAFITYAQDENAEEIVDSKTYADYIANRPGAERFGTHGLFTDEGEPVHLSKVSEELNHYPGQVYTVILSLKREDAERLGFQSGARWRDFLRGHTETLATNFKIPVGHLKWYAAFHDAGHHPHVHLMVYSSVPGEGHLSEYGVEKIRSTLAKDIFSQDLLCTYQKQTELRDDLRQESRERMAQIVEEINAGSYENEAVRTLIAQLAERLSKTSGKKVYGYLKPDVKCIVDEIVSELAKDSRIRELYGLWYRQREDVLRTYTDTFPERIPLEQNPKFKSIRNAVIKEAMKAVPQQPDSMPLRTSLPERESEEESADDDDAGDFEADHPYPGQPASPPEQPQHTPVHPSVPERRYTPARYATANLLRSLARMIQEKSELDRKPQQRIDRKQWQKEQAKKQAMGIRD